MSQSDAIRIDDLGEPKYSNFAQQVIAATADVETELSVEAISALAKEQLAEVPLFLDEGMAERLALLCECMNDDANLSALGRITNQGILLRYLVQRSRLEELYRHHPEIDAEEVQQPIIIAGLPRSGTTHLLNLISVDTRLRSLSYAESLEPIPLPEERQAIEAGEDPRIERCRASLEVQDQIVPLFRIMHEMTPEHIHEEAELMGMDFSTVFFETYALMPKWRDYYLRHDQTPHYQFLKRALKALQWLKGPRRWILKSPQHMEQLPALHSVFPDATFVLPHRDPVSVIASMLTMQTYVSRLSRAPLVPSAIGGYWADRLTRKLRQCVIDRDALPAAQTLDVVFDEITHDGLAVVEKIYELAGHPMSDEVRAAMLKYVADNPRGKYGQILYDLKEDFDIDPKVLRNELQFYYDKFLKGQGAG